MDAISGTHSGYSSLNESHDALDISGCNKNPSDLIFFPL